MKVMIRREKPASMATYITCSAVWVASLAVGGFLSPLRGIALVVGVYALLVAYLVIRFPHPNFHPDEDR